MSSSQGTVSCVICGKTLNTEEDVVGEANFALTDTKSEMLMHYRNRFYCESDYKKEMEEKFSLV